MGTLSLWLGAAIILAIELNAVFGKLWRWLESVKAVIHSGLLLTIFFAWLVWYN